MAVVPPFGALCALGRLHIVWLLLMSVGLLSAAGGLLSWWLEEDNLVFWPTVLLAEAIPSLITFLVIRSCGYRLFRNSTQVPAADATTPVVPILPSD